jgi:hypothetical protein
LRKLADSDVIVIVDKKRLRIVDRDELAAMTE